MTVTGIGVSVGGVLAARALVGDGRDGLGARVLEAVARSAACVGTAAPEGDIEGGIDGATVVAEVHAW